MLVEECVGRPAERAKCIIASGVFPIVVNGGLKFGECCGMAPLFPKVVNEFPRSRLHLIVDRIAILAPGVWEAGPIRKW